MHAISITGSGGELLALCLGGERLAGNKVKKGSNGEMLVVKLIFVTGNYAGPVSSVLPVNPRGKVMLIRYRFRRADEMREQQ